MKLLGLDTALNACSVAIIEGSPEGEARVLARIVSPGGKGNAERLLPVLEDARRQAGLELQELYGIAATIGPGSFTGIRTALATARALGLALSRPVWGITTTEALATAAAQPGIATIAAIDARRDEVYIQAFAAAANGLGAPLQEPALLPVAAAAAQLPSGPLTLVGSGAKLLRQAAGPRDDLQLSPAAPDPDPAIVARLAMQRPAPARAPAPLYIRPPDAALPAVAQPRAQLAVTIQPCGVESAALLAELHGEAFAQDRHGGWSSQAFTDLLAMPGAFALLAVHNDQPAGFVLLRKAADEAEVITLAVRPRLQRLGIARGLMREGVQRLNQEGAAACFLEVAEDNHAAQALYKGLGFAEVGRRAGYYEGPAGSSSSAASRVNAIVMKISTANPA